MLLLIVILVLGFLWRLYKYHQDTHFSEYICPICGQKYDNWFHKRLIYHIRYYPEKTINACLLCNHVEYLWRTGKLDKITHQIIKLRV